MLYTFIFHTVIFKKQYKPPWNSANTVIIISWLYIQYIVTAVYL